MLQIDSRKILFVILLFITWPNPSNIFTNRGTLFIRYVVHKVCFLILQPLIVLVIILIYNSRATSKSVESVYKTNLVLTDRTSFK
jgi:hypothetical protein